MAQMNKINERQQQCQRSKNLSIHSDQDIKTIIRKNLSQLISPCKEMTKTSKKSEAKPKADKMSFLCQLFWGSINSIPIVLMMAFCAHILYKDYEARNFNFWSKHKHWGSIFPHDMYAEVKCHDPDYVQDRKQFPTCAPKHCARLFNDYILTDEETDMLLNIAKRGFTYGESDGGASIFEVYSGIVSKGKLFANVQSILRKKGINSFLSEQEIKGFNNVKDKIVQLIESKFGIKNVYLTKPVFFSKMTNKNASTIHDEYWHKHVDKQQFEGFHYTALVYLNTHQVDYFGGRFVWIDANNLTETHEPRKGRVSVFSSGTENRHYVEKVLSGTRYAMTIPFTCDIKQTIKVDR